MLRQHFLPDPFDAMGIYADPTRVHAHTRAFLVLSHAEIETFLEDWAKSIARASEQVWTSSGRVTAPLTYLLATLSEPLGIAQTLDREKDSPQRLGEHAVKLFRAYYKRIKGNHGVKEKNVLALFSPIGMSRSAVGATLLPNLDQLGALRGEHAHQSAKAVQSTLDPETEYGRVTSLVDELLELDDWLQSYKRRIR